MANKKNTSAAQNTTTTETKAAKVRKMPESVNSFDITGRVCERGIKVVDSKNKKGEVIGKTLQFSMGHNMGKDRQTLFLDVVMFSKNGAKQIELPVDLIKKGASIRVKGYIKPGRGFAYTNKAGEDKSLGRFDLVALSIEENPYPAKA